MRVGQSPSGMKSPQQREHFRVPVHKSAILHFDGATLPVVLKDLSAGGSRLMLTSSRDDIVPDVSAHLDIPGFMRIPVDVKWRHSTQIGVAFDVPEHRRASIGPQIKRLLGR